MKFNADTTLEEMLKVKSFAQLLEDGDILDVHGAAAKSGYTIRHIHRLCREQRIACILRGASNTEAHYYFYPWQITELFKYRKARVKA